MPNQTGKVKKKYPEMQFIANAWDKNAMIELTTSWRFCSAFCSFNFFSFFSVFFSFSAQCVQYATLTYLLYIYFWFSWLSFDQLLDFVHSFLFCGFIWTFCPFCFSCLCICCFFFIFVSTIRKEHTSHTFYKCAFVSIK